MNIENQNIDFHYLDEPECLACKEGWKTDIHEKVRGHWIIYFDRTPVFCETPWCFYRDGDIKHKADFVLNAPGEFLNVPIHLNDCFVKGFVLLSISNF